MLTQSSFRLAYLSMSNDEYIEKLTTIISNYKEKILSLQIKCDSLQTELKIKNLQEQQELMACVPLWTINGDKE